MFVVFGGLPGCGKSSIAQRLASRTAAVYLRVDSIEQAIRSSGTLAPDADMGPAGYVSLCAVAADNLRLGHVVIADSVNPIELTREAYRETARRAGVDVFEIEVVCSDASEHRRRVETRAPTVEGLILPTWEEVESRQYEPWRQPHLRLDTAMLSVDQCVSELLAASPALAARVL